MALLIKNGEIVTADSRCRADILCEGDTVTRIGAGVTAPAGAEVIDAAGKFIFPGFIDPHVHIWDLTTRIWPWLDAPRTDFSGSNAAIARSYLIEEFLAEGGGVYEISKIVHIEAVPGDPLGESAYEQAVADRTRNGQPYR